VIEVPDSDRIKSLYRQILQTVKKGTAEKASLQMTAENSVGLCHGQNLQ